MLMAVCVVGRGKKLLAACPNSRTPVRSRRRKGDFGGWLSFGKLRTLSLSKRQRIGVKLALSWRRTAEAREHNKESRKPTTNPLHRGGCKITGWTRLMNIAA